jgi:hypothetical protein
MNLALLKRNVGSHVQIEPPAIYLDPLGREVGKASEDWVIQSVTDAEVRLTQPCLSPISFVIGPDAIHGWTGNPNRIPVGGTRYGFLKLLVQVTIQNDTVSLRVCGRPGERVPPPPVQMIEKAVTFDYIRDSGLQERQVRDGYRVYLERESQVAQRTELEGWEVVIEKDARGVLCSYCIKGRDENLVLLKKRITNLQLLASLSHWKQQPGFVSCRAHEQLGAVEFSFADPVTATAFMLRMNRQPNGMRCVMAPGRVDTVLAYITEVAVA